MLLGCESINDVGFGSVESRFCSGRVWESKGLVQSVGDSDGSVGNTGDVSVHVDDDSGGDWGRKYSADGDMVSKSTKDPGWYGEWRDAGVSGSGDSVSTCRPEVTGGDVA